jgi:hypothetical protein
MGGTIATWGHEMSETADATIESETDDGQDERVTVIAKEFTPAAMEYHRRRLGEQGYAIEGPIGRHRFVVVEDTGASVELFDGAPYYAATFIRKTR